MTYRSALAAAGACLLAAGCGGSTAVTEITGPGAVRCQTGVSAPPTIPSGGSRVSLTVVAARECTWTAASDASWLQVSPGSGQGEGSLTINAAANPQARPRTGAVTVNENRLSISQEAAPCRFELGGSPRVPHQGGGTTITVSTLEGCDWAASSPAGWARVLTPRGSGSGAVQVEVVSNDGPQRTVTLSIGGQPFTLTQEARPLMTPSPDPNPPAPNPPPTNPPGTPTPPGNGGQRVELSGRALLVDGSCPNLSFVVEWRRVYTTGDTRFRGNCRKIRNGTEVSVEGRMQSDGRVRADDVRVRDDDDDDD